MERADEKPNAMMIDEYTLVSLKLNENSCLAPKLKFLKASFCC